MKYITIVNNKIYFKFISFHSKRKDMVLTKAFDFIMQVNFDTFIGRCVEHKIWKKTRWCVLISGKVGIRENYHRSARFEQDVRREWTPQGYRIGPLLFIICFFLKHSVGSTPLTCLDLPGLCSQWARSSWLFLLA